MTTVIFTVIAVSSFLYWHNDEQHKQDFIRNNLMLVKLVADATTLPLVFGDKTGIHEQMEKLLEEPRILYLVLTNAQGEIMSNYDPIGLVNKAPILDSQKDFIWLEDGLYFAIPINRNNQLLGTLAGAFRLTEYKQLQNSEQIFILIAILVAVSCSFVMALLLRRFVMTSIQQLETHARRIAKHPGLDEIITYPARKNDEISQLYGAFNLLMKQVRTRETEILLLNASLESKIKQRTEALSAALTVKSAFLANMSHEIRTPMNAILGMHQLALETELTHKQRNYLTKAHGAAKWLLGILNNVLDFSKLEAGKIQLENTPFNLDRMIHYLQDVSAPLINDKPLTLRFSVDPQIPTSLIGDQLRLGQILLNLLSNAIKFTHQGNVSVDIKKINQDGDQVQIRFSVADTGIGISEAQQKNLFNAFTQADSSTTRKFGGTGLGLAISKELVNAMGGTINLESRPNCGSCFTFALTLGVGKPSTQPSLDTLQLNSNSLPDLSGMHLLLVEDNPVNQELIMEILTNHGLKLDLAENGVEAIALIEKNSYDAVLMDCQMPVMDGFIATQTLRANPRYQRLPIIAMTANVLTEDRERCLASGMNDHIGKPIDWDQLFEILAQYFHKSVATELTPIRTHLVKTPVTYEFPTLSNVDRAAAQKIVSGNIKLYRKLLALVQSKHENGTAIIKSAYQTGDYQRVIEQAHTLSGALSSIGALKLSILMKTLQHKCQAALPHSEIQPLLEECDIRFNELMLEITQSLQLQDAKLPNASPAIESSTKLKPKILLVEDRTTNQEIAANMLEDFHLTIANNGQEALERLDAQTFDAILMDIHMPTMDGFETTRRIRQRPDGQEIPIIALTAAATQRNKAEAFAAGMNAHLAKPMTQQQLLRVLIPLINHRPAAMEQLAPIPHSGTGPSNCTEEIRTELESLLSTLQAHEAICQSRLSAICAMIEEHFSLSQSQKISQLIEYYDYANALGHIHTLISKLKTSHADQDP